MEVIGRAVLLRHGAMRSLVRPPVCALDVGVIPAGIQLRVTVRANSMPVGRPTGDRTARSNPSTGQGSTVLYWSTSTTPSSKCTRYAKQGSGYGYSGVRGLNALIATVTTEHAAPVILGKRLRKGACGSARGAARIVAAHPGHRAGVCVRVRRHKRCCCGPIPRSTDTPPWRRRSAGGAQVSITVRLDGQDRDRRDRRAGLDTHRVHTPPSTTKPPGKRISRAEVSRDRVHRV